MTTATKRRTTNGTKPETTTVRVAIYTRQSVADDLEFNSLEAQRQAVGAYVASQRGLGWVALPERYDDHGFSGGTIERPAFQSLLQDVQAGKIDLVAVYKLDRLSRSINDFVRVMDLFQRHDVGFVSTTQSFDTSTSLGRMTVNLLATFATYERDMISERTRDKVAATKKRGFWCGGTAPVGYEVQEKRLVIISDEAQRVREIFQCYLDIGSLLGTVAELNRRGWRTKGRKRNGERLPGKPWDKGSLRFLLTNPIYAGRIRHRGEVYDGVHEAIIDQQTWAAVQHRLAQNAKGGPKRTTSTALLQGIIRCGVCGSAMTTHHAKRGARRYSSYVCVKMQKQGAAACPGSRAPVGEMERFVVDRIREIGRDPRLVRETIAAAKRGVKERQPELAAELKRLERDRERLEAERKNLLDVVAQGKNGNGSASILQRLGEVDVALTDATKRHEATRGEIAGLESATIDEEDLRMALSSFDGIWSELFPQEKARILHLLLECLTFDAGKGEVAITFRPGGVRVLAREAGEEGT